MTIERAHAKLSASGSEKWMTCTPSAHFEEQFEDEGSEFSKEGTFAHELLSHRLLGYLGRPQEFKAETDIPDYAKYWSTNLHDYVVLTMRYVMDAIKAARERCADPVIMVEQRLDFRIWVPEGFGTGDVVIISDGLVEVLDLKYGKGIYVDAHGNSQMRLYGLGALNELSHLYDIKQVTMTIMQPRLDNWGSETLDTDALLAWADNEVVPKAKLAWEGAGVFVAGDHCTSCFCKARYTCPARAEQSLAVAKQEFADGAPVKAEDLSMARIAELLPKADMVIDWFNDLKAYSLEQATKHNNIVPGFKLVEGRSNRKYSNQDDVAAKLKAAGIAEAVMYERSLLGITAMQQALGKKVFTEVLGGLIVKPEGKPTLVPEGDKRPALASPATAVEDFS